jgi:hypothetical protein
LAQIVQAIALLCDILVYGLCLGNELEWELEFGLGECFIDICGEMGRGGVDGCATGTDASEGLWCGGMRQSGRNKWMRRGATAMYKASLKGAEEEVVVRGLGP